MQTCEGGTFIDGKLKPIFSAQKWQTLQNMCIDQKLNNKT